MGTHKEGKSKITSLQNCVIYLKMIGVSCMAMMINNIITHTKAGFLTAFKGSFDLSQECLPLNSMKQNNVNKLHKHSLPL
jgi:hypothetical protein